MNNTLKKKSDWSKLNKRWSLYLILLVLMVVCTFLNKNFLTWQNLTNVIRQQSVIIIIAFGELILISAGMIDLAPGSVLALSGCLSVGFYNNVSQNFPLVFLVAIAVAVAFDMISATIITTFKAPPFIAGLAVDAMARGTALLYTGGKNLYTSGDYCAVGQGYVFKVIPIPIFIMLVIFLVTYYLTKYTKFGRSIFAIGGNQEAAIASGIRVDTIKRLAFIYNGILIGIASVIYMSRVNIGSPTAGTTYGFSAITATIIGGTSFSGGVGFAVGTLVGALIVGFLENILNLLSVNSYIQQIVRGFIIAVAVAWDIYSKNKKK